LLALLSLLGCGRDSQLSSVASVEIEKHKWKALGSGFVESFGPVSATITPSGMLTVAAFYGVAFLVLLCYANLKLKAIGEPAAAPTSK
jgi:hypothetical protein